MKILPDSPRPSAVTPSFRSSLRSRSLSCEIEFCVESLREVDLSIVCEACNDRIDDALSPQIASQSSSYGKGFYAEKIKSCSLHHFDARQADNDDDDDDLEWANAMKPVLRNPGYGDDKGFYPANMASCNENRVRFHCKRASYPFSIAMQQHSGLLRPNSGPFSGTFKSVAKPNPVPSIIPISLLRKKLLGFDVCEPMSPEVTCLGRIRSKVIHSKDVHETTDEKLGSAALQKGEKGRCFDTKNQLCGRKSKSRKKKKVPEKARCLSRKRRFASKETTDSKSFSSSEIAQTRREKAASLAISLSGLLDDVRRLERDDAHYVPSVPPPNSLLLMRGGRMMHKPSLSQESNMHEATIDDYERECVDSLVEIPSGADVKKLREGALPHFSLLDLIDMEESIMNEDFAPSKTEDTMTAEGIPAIPQSISLLFEKENCATGEDNETMNSKGSFATLPPGATLWQRRAVAELHAIEVKQIAKVEIKQPTVKQNQNT